MEKILFISYCFPPMAGIPPMRALRFTRYLPNYGYKPVVLTVENGYYPITGKDETLLQFIPDNLEIHRVKNKSITLKFFQLIENIMKKRRDGKNLSRQEIDNARSHSSMFRLLFNLKREYIFFPDMRCGWIKPAVKKGHKIIENIKNVKLIYACGDPWSVLIAGMKLKQKTGLPLVIDLRDPWAIDMANFRDSTKNKLWEAMVFSSADRIILATDNMFDEYKKVYPVKIISKMRVVKNGSDPYIMGKVKESKRNDDKFRFVYAGRTRQITENLLIALGRLKQDNDDILSQMEFHFYGWTTPDLIQSSKNRGLQETIKFFKPISTIESISAQKSADILLLIIQPSPTAKQVLTGKIFEYIAVGKPILALAPSESEASRLIMDNNLGYVVNPNNIDGIAQTLLDLYDLWKKKKIHNRPTDTGITGRFDGKTLTEELARIFDEI